MSELFTQTNKQKELFRTEEDIVANIQTQFGMPHTGKDLLLDAKMGPNKDQSSRLDSEPDALSDTGMSDDVGAGDTSGILHDSAGGNKNTITGSTKAAQTHRAPVVQAPIMICCAASTRTVTIKLLHTGLWIK